MWIEIEPFDTLFFRDGKPFSMGEEVWANAIFPPYPSTIYGALRTLYFSYHPESISSANTRDDPTKRLVLRNIFLKYNDKYYFPVPSDIVTLKDKDVLRILKLTEVNNFYSNYPLTHFLIVEGGEKVEFIDGFIELEDFKRYLNGEMPLDFPIRISDIKVDEPKVGIALDRNTRSTEEHKIYRVDMLRLKKGVRIVVEFDNLTIPNEGLMKLGGEGKVAYYKEIKAIPELPEVYVESNIFKVYFSTPVYFMNGWYPGGMDANNEYEWNYQNLKLRLIAASFKGYYSIGGFDMKMKRPKNMRRYIPPGTIFYFELIEGDLQRVLDVFNNKRISEELSNEGFGIAYIGK